MRQGVVFENWKDDNPYWVKSSYIKNTRRSFYQLKKKTKYSTWMKEQYSLLCGLCPRCGVKMYLPTEGHIASGRTATADHIVPISRGGTNDFENFAVLCATCNHKKKNTLEDPHE